MATPHSRGPFWVSLPLTPQEVMPHEEDWLSLYSNMKTLTQSSVYSNIKMQTPLLVCANVNTMTP